MDRAILIIGIGSIIANLIVFIVVCKIYTKYWKDVTICWKDAILKKRAEDKPDNED